MSLYTYGTILQEVQDACVQLNLVKPTGVFDTNDENALIMGSYGNIIGTMLQDINQWQQFYKTFTIIGDATKLDFDLPPDFSRMTDDTGWSYSKRRPVIILNQQSWAAIKSWLSQSFFINPACLLQDDKVTFMVAPGLGEKITFSYTSKYWVIDGTDPAVFKERLDSNADIPMHDSILFTIALRIKWLESRGMNTTGAQQDFNERFKMLTMRNNMAQNLSLNGGTFTGFRYLDNFWNTPDTNIGY